MKVFQSKYSSIPGTSYSESVKQARHEYHIIQKRTPRRQPYVRSKYFTKDKIFINEFWKHLEQKSWGDRARRVKLFLCGIDLVRNNTYDPEFQQNPNKPQEVFYRFVGKTKEGELFYVQIKENKRTQRKDLMSIFPAK